MSEHDELTRVTEPNQEEGCAVDWSWLSGLTIESATSDLQHLRIRFADGQTLTVQAALYRGKPFLAFKPHQAPGRSES